MSSNVLAILLANVLMFVLGAGLLPLLRVAVTGRELVAQLSLAYPVGLAATGIAAAELALVHVPVGKVGLPLLAFGTLAAGLWRLRVSDTSLTPGVTEASAGAPESPCSEATSGGDVSDTSLTPRVPERRRAGLSPWTLPAVAGLAVAAVYLANAARLFAVKPLVENDGWALWGLRAQALYHAGHPFAPVFTREPYPALQYPLFLPELEAIDARFMSAFDGTAIHVQLLLLAVAFAAGAWTLLRPYAPSLLLALALLAVLTAPAFFGQLQTNSADVPLAMAIALGVAALAVWIRTGARGLLPTAALFLTAGAMTKNEGELFALTAFLAAFAATPRARLRPLLGAAGAWLALIVPWHLWLLSHDVTGTTWKLSHLVHPGYLADNAHRVGSAARQLLDQVWLASSWSRLPWLVVAGFGLALLLRRFRVASFGAAWLLLSFGGLLLVYWSSPLTLEHNLYNSADRTIDTLVITGVLLVPVLLAVERGEPAPREAAPAPLPATTEP